MACIATPDVDNWLKAGDLSLAAGAALREHRSSFGGGRWTVNFTGGSKLTFGRADALTISRSRWVDDPPWPIGGTSGRWLDALERVQGWLLPPRCVLCLDPGRPPTLDLCPACEADLPRLELGRAANLPEGPLHGVAFAPFRYGWPVDALVRGFKYHGRLAHGRVLGTLLAEAALDSTVAVPDLLVPVPLHPSRERERGYNQAWELARVVARRLGVPADPTLCMRTRATPPQATLDAAARRANLADAFAVVRAPGVAHVAIVDDVLTTGATAAALARALLARGVQRVDVWTVARA